MSTKQQRKAIALRMAEIATKHGATVEIDEEGPYRPRTVTVACRFPEVSVSFDIDDLHHGGIMAHWYGAARPLHNLNLSGVRVFDSVNPVHRRKATTYYQDAEAFAQWFDVACAVVAAGEVFE